MSNNITNPFLDYLFIGPPCIVLFCRRYRCSLLVKQVFLVQAFATEEEPCRLFLTPFTALEMEPVFYCSKQHKKRDLLAYLKYIVEVSSLYKLYFFELRAYRHHKVHFHLVIFKVVPTFYYKSQNDLRRVGGGVGWRCLVSQ